MGEWIGSRDWASALLSAVNTPDKLRAGPWGNTLASSACYWSALTQCTSVGQPLFPVAFTQRNRAITTHQWGRILGHLIVNGVKVNWKRKNKKGIINQVTHMRVQNNFLFCLCSNSWKVQVCPKKMEERGKQEDWATALNRLARKQKGNSRAAMYSTAAP